MKPVANRISRRDAHTEEEDSDRRSLTRGSLVIGDISGCMLGRV
jgi:hypothetical protein